MADGDNYYTVHCKDRFDKNEKAIEKVGDKVGELTTVVQNGLTHRQKRIEKTQWLIIATFAGKILADIFI